MGDLEKNRDTSNENKLARRNFLKVGTAAGVGALVVPQVMQQVKAAETAAATNNAAAATSTAATAATTEEPKKLTMKQVMKVAREKMYPICRVCPECDGVACAGEVPGMGGIGSGQGFRNNYKALQEIDLVMRTFHDVTKPELPVNIFGHEISMPLMSAVTGGVTYNMGGKMTEYDYINSILGGCLDAGTLGWAADGIGDDLEVFKTRMDVLKQYGGKGIVVIKPKAQDEIIKRIKLAEEAGALAFAIDIDSAGRAARALPGQIVEPKTPKQLEEIAKSTNLPFIIKGIMTVDEAKQAVDVGAKGIVVSNHGGRVLDYTPATATVLPDIAAAVKGKVLLLVDGGVRRGYDVLKMVALGADACLMGRPLVRAAHGAGKDGVSLLLKTVRNELTDSMVLTGVASAKNVPSSVIVRKGQA